MKIPIKKTNRKVPISRWVLDGDKKCIWYKDTFDIFNNADKLQGRRNPVTDISKGLENPLYVGSDFMEAIRNPKITSTYPERIPGTKPSLLTRVKERFKR